MEREASGHSGCCVGGVCILIQSRRKYSTGVLRRASDMFMLLQGFPGPVTEDSLQERLASVSPGLPSGFLVWVFGERAVHTTEASVARPRAAPKCPAGPSPTPASAVASGVGLPPPPGARSARL